MACIILQKQIEHIDGKKENIIIPSVAMKKFEKENKQVIYQRIRINVNVYMNDIVEARDREQVESGSSSTNASDGNDVKMTTSSSESISNEYNFELPRT